MRTKITQITYKRLEGVVERWRRFEKELEDQEKYVLAKIYQECANDLDLALRDDTTLGKK